MAKVSNRDIKAQVRAIEKNAKRVIKDRIPHNIERALTAVGTTVMGRAFEYMPLAYANLQNSSYQIIEVTPNSYTLSLGNTVEYALPLHSPEPGGKMDGWKPMDPYEREWRTRSAKDFVGNGSGGMNVNAKQDWFNIGYKEKETEVNQIMLGDLQL